MSNSQFECLGENTEKYITFSVPIKKENENGKTITYKLKFIDTCRFIHSYNYQSLLIICLKLTIIKIAKHVWREKRSNQNVILLNLKIIDWITDAKKIMVSKWINWKVSKNASILLRWS